MNFVLGAFAFTLLLVSTPLWSTAWAGETISAYLMNGYELKAVTDERLDTSGRAFWLQKGSEIVRCYVRVLRVDPGNPTALQGTEIDNCLPLSWRGTLPTYTDEK